MTAASTPEGAAAGAVPPPSDSPYHFGIDPESDSTHAKVVRLVGHDRRVLELGPAGGYMSRVLADNGCTVVGIELDPAMAAEASAHCERVIVGDIDVIDLDAELGDERFDVVVAADVLEHLKDPLSALKRLERHLTPDEGFYVISVPNIAHGSVRLALLQGRFDYQDLGLLDRTHLRFFTRESLQALLEAAGLGITAFHRQLLNIDASEVTFDGEGLPAGLAESIGGDLDALTYQFVLAATPLGFAGMREAAQRLEQQAEVIDELTRTLEDTRRDWAFTQNALQATEAALARMPQLESIAAREGELRAALIDTHDQLLSRDSTIATMKAALEEAQARRQELQVANDELSAAQNQAREIISARDDEVLRLRTRLERILSSPPVQAWSSLGRLPLLRDIKARRSAGYETAVRQATRD